MSHCKELGWKVGDKFVVTRSVPIIFNQGDILELIWDDNSTSPKFKRIVDEEEYYFSIYDVKPLEKPTSEFSGVVWEGMRFQAACPEEYLEISEAINKLEVFRLDA